MEDNNDRYFIISVTLRMKDLSISVGTLTIKTINDSHFSSEFVEECVNEQFPQSVGFSITWFTEMNKDDFDDFNHREVEIELLNDLLAEKDEQEDEDDNLEEFL